MTEAFTMAGAYTFTARDLHPWSTFGTLILNSENPDTDGLIVYCRTEVAAYAHELIAGAFTPTIALDGMGNVVSVQNADNSRRRKFPKAA